MQLKKYTHACFTVTTNNHTLVVDPGIWTDNFIIPDDTVGIVITHQHPDHYSPELVASILQQSPNATLFTTDDTTIINAADVQIVNPGETRHIGPFLLEFFGGEHAVIDTHIPVIHNLGVYINQQIYYPGDSFALPNRPINTLVLPVAAPWMKIAESLTFLRAIAPRLALPTHDSILNGTGKALVDRLCAAAAEEIGTTYQRIDEITVPYHTVDTKK